MNDLFESYDIVAVRHDEAGRIAAIKLDNGKSMDIETAYTYAESGMFPGYVPATRDDRRYLRGEGDGDRSNNLDNLPEF